MQKKQILIITLVLSMVFSSSSLTRYANAKYNRDNEIEFLNRIKKYFDVGVSKEKVSKNILLEILPGTWQAGIHSLLKINKQMHFELVDFQENHDGIIINTGVITVVENGISMNGNIYYIDYCKLSEIVHLKKRQYVFLIVFTKFAFWGEQGMNASIIVKEN